MPGDVAKLLNALALMAVDTVLALAFVDQLWFSDLPCPLCILQRAGLTAAGFGAGFGFSSAGARILHGVLSSFGSYCPVISSAVALQLHFGGLARLPAWQGKLLRGTTFE